MIHLLRPYSFVDWPFSEGQRKPERRYARNEDVLQSYISNVSTTQMEDDELNE